MKTILSILLFAITLQGGDYDLPRYAVRKVEKAIKKTWPKLEVQSSPLKVSKKSLEAAGLNKKDVSFFLLEGKKGKLGYLMLDKAPSKSRKFDYLVIYDMKIRVKKVRVLIYRENYGGEISNKRWLRQFEGKGPDDKISFGDNIDGISGATISARSITHDISLMTERLGELKEKALVSSE